jgi:heptosyltransferase-1
MTRVRRPPKRPTYSPRPGAAGLTILHVLPWLNYGGVETYVLKLASRQSRDGHRVLVASSGGLLEPQLAAAGISHLRVPLNGIHFLPAPARLCRAVAREQVDLVCAHNWTAGAVAYLVARRMGIAYCLTVHGVRSPFQRHFVYYWGRKVIAVSRESRDQLVREFGLPEQRVVESMIGVDTERFRPAPPSAPLRAELGLEADAPVVVHVSRLSHSKAGVALALIAAMPALSDRHPHAQALIAGDGPLAGRVRSAADAMNQRLARRAVIFAGPRADIAGLLNLGAVAVGTATVALECMACGKPLVAAGKAGFLGAVTPANMDDAEAVCFGDHPPSQRDARLAPVTSDALAAAVQAVLDAPQQAREFGHAGRRAAVERFSLERMARSVEQVYRSILADPERVRAIAVFHLNQVGDLLFCLPALKALRKRFPSASITGVIRPHLMDLLRECPYVDRLLPRGRDSDPAQVRRLVAGLRAERPDLAVAFSHSPATTALARLVGAAERIGFADAGLPWLLTRRVQARGLPSPAKIMRLVACLGGDAADSSYVGLLRISAADREAARRLLAEAGVREGTPFVAMGPTASGGRSHKNWSVERFAAVADALAQGAQVVIVGAQEDAAYAARIIAAMQRAAVSLAGRTTTGCLAAVLERADLFVGIDSGPMHVAAAMGTPVVALFGPSDPRQTGPHGAGHAVVTKGFPCSPCKWPCETRDCMAAIAVKDVLEAVQRVRAGVPGPAEGA